MPSDSVPLPLARRPVVRTSSLEEARQVYSRMSLPVRLEQDPRRRFEWEANYATLGPLTLSAHRFADGFTAASDSTSDTLVLTVPLGRGAGECAYGRSVVIHAPARSGGLSSGAAPVVMRTDDEYRSASVHIPDPAMRNAYLAWSGEPPRRPLRFAPVVDLTSGTMRSFLRTLRYAFDEADDPDSLASHAVVAQRIAESLLFGLLLSQPRLDDDVAPPATAGAKHVRRASEFLEANAGRPVRIGEAAAAAGVGVRTLQEAFLAHLGVSPLEFLRARRLSNARAALLARTDASIAQIALDHGFAHLGRFSVAYRASYGETPTETRARGRATKRSRRTRE